MDKADNEEAENLTKEDLTSSGAQAILGLIVARQLLENGQASLYLDEENKICLARANELSLDGLPEEMAINELAAQEFSDEEIANYLKGRDARLRRG